MLFTGAGVQADADGGADGPLEVRGQAQRALQARARHFELVPARHRVALVELTRDQPGSDRQCLQVHTAGPLHRHADLAAGVLDVVELEPEVRADGRDEVPDPVRHAHLDAPPSKQKAWTETAHAFARDD